MNGETVKKLKDMTRFHQGLVGKIVADIKPVRPAPSVFVQWMVWAGSALLVVMAALSMIGGPQFEILEKLTDPSSGGFLLLAFALSGFAAWMGIASSKPDFIPRKGPRWLAGGLVLFLFSMPVLFFGEDSLSRVWAQNNADGWFCFRTVVLVAIPSWILLGWMASRNASFHPGWTGLWLGASAFLLGTGTIQLHCARWETCHMLADHLLPLAVFLFIPIWIGGYWFARWKK